MKILLFVFLFFLFGCIKEQQNNQITMPYTALNGGTLITLVPTITKFYQQPRTLVLTNVGTFKIIGEISGVTGSQIIIHKSNKNSILCIVDSPTNKRCFDIIGF